MRGGIYRSRSGMILGVCKGISDYFDFSVFWVRFVAVVLFLLSGVWPILVIYFIAALILKPKPVIPIGSSEEQEFYDSYVHRRASALDRIKRRYRNLENRIQRMEHRVTSKEYDWEKRLNT